MIAVFHVKPPTTSYCFYLTYTLFITKPMSVIHIENESVFLSVCKQHNFPVTDKILLRLKKYVDLLLYHNKAINLISRKDEANIWMYHILHCTRLLFHKKFPAGVRVLDLGTGGGLPGIVLAIFNPSIRLTLLDATGKKIDVVGSIVDELGLTNISTVWGRAEEIGRKPGYYRQTDIVVARAVASLDRLVKWSLPFLRPPATVPQTDPGVIPTPSLVAYKGGDITKELASLKSLKRLVSFDVIELEPQEEKKVVILNILNYSVR
jgi:16S rRNA (guanine527-N7)-methyltransferase